MPKHNVSHSRSDRKVAKALKRLEHLLERQNRRLSAVSTLMEDVMADKDQVSQSIADLKQAIVDDQKSDQAVVDTLVAANADLQKKIDDLNAGGNATEAADLQEIMDKINDAKSAISGVNPAGTPPGETPVA